MRYYCELKDQFGNTEQKLLTKKQWHNIVDNNPDLEIRILYYVSGKFSYER